MKTFETDAERIAWANTKLREVSDAELALLAVSAIVRDDETTEPLLDAYEREATRRGIRL